MGSHKLNGGDDRFSVCLEKEASLCDWKLSEELAQIQHNWSTTLHNCSVRLGGGSNALFGLSGRDDRRGRRLLGELRSNKHFRGRGHCMAFE